MPARSRLSIAALTAFAVSAAAGNAVAQTPDADALYHRFTLPDRAAWGQLRVPLAPFAWRVGHPDGPPASEDQLRAVLSGLAGIEVGGRCAGWVDGPTAYPCGFAVRAFGLEQATHERFAATVFDNAPDPERVRVSVAQARADIAAAGLIQPVLDTPRRVTLRMPAHSLGDPRAAYGHTVAFELRALPNPLVPSDFDRSSGALVLRGAGSMAAQASAEWSTTRR